MPRPGGRMHGRKGNDNFNDCFKKEGRMEKTPTEVIPIQDDPVSSPRQTNPFLIANILETIFPFLDHSTLKSCRTVSRLWSAMSSPLISTRSTLSLEGPFTDPRSESFLSTMATSPSPSLPMGSLIYNLHHFEYSARNFRFFSHFGASIKCLTLQAYALQNPANALGTTRFLRVLATILGQNTPSLEQLTITHLHHLEYNSPLDEETHELLALTKNPSIKSLTINFEAQSLSEPPRRGLHCMTLLARILAITPNLTALHTECRCSGETFLYFLMTLRDSQISGQLTKFTINGGPLDNCALTILNEIPFSQLKSLRINSLVTKVDEVRFYSFLEKLSPTLQEFVMFGDKWGKYGMDNRMVRWEEGFSLDFPMMPHLKLFRHQNYEGLRLGGEEFLKKLPALEELIIRDFQPSLGAMMLCPELTVFGNLFNPKKRAPVYVNALVKKLTLDVIYIPSYENLGCLKKLLGMFPNIEEIEMAVSFAYNNTYVGHVLEYLGQSGVKRVKITFYQCNELRSMSALTSFHLSLSKYIPSFCHLQKLDFILEDLPVMSRIKLPLCVVQCMMTCKSLTVANFTGFSLGESPEETEKCRKVMDDKLVQWTVKEQEVPFPHFSCFDY